MPPVISGKYGSVEFADCRASLKEMVKKGILYDFSFWDPPYNIDFGTKPFNIHGSQYKSRSDNCNCKLIPYPDSLPPGEYVIFLRDILAQLLRVSNCIIVHPGYNNEKLWYTAITPAPEFSLSHYVVNPKSGGLNCHLRNRLPMLGFGKPPKQFNTDMFKDIVKWGFIPHDNYTHPCPMNSQFLIDLIEQSGAKSVFDPMCGSGAIPEACEALGVQWNAVELKEEYAGDIERRVKKGQELYKTLHSTPKITEWYK
jgi:hypothetical protein